jgi:trimeric autotransporter adhesin
MKKNLHSTLTRSAVSLFGLAVCGASSLVAAPGDSHWDRQFGLPGTNNKVYALRFNGDNLYASGVAVGAGGLLATNTGVDIFDGTNWSSALGELAGGLCVIYDVGFLRNDIYVAGIFNTAGGASAPGLAKWNGSDWSSIGFAGAALALVSDGTNLYVGGSFTNAGGVLNTNIARYDGTNWYSVGGGVGYYNYNSLYSYVYVLQLHNGLLYAGGIFTNAGAIAATNVAVWNGSNWSSLGAGSANGVNNQVSALAFQGDLLYVGGSFSVAGGVSANGIATWDGATWSALGAGCKGGVSCIGILGSDIYVGGGFTNVGGVSARAFAKWDGVSWTTWPTTDGVFQYPLNDVPNRMVVQNGWLYIGGGFNQAGDVIANHVVFYDGSNFHPLGAKPANGFATPQLNVSCIGQADDGIYVGGLFTAAGTTLVNRIARWDGTTWNDVGGGTMGGTSSANRVLAIAGLGTDVYVGGTFTNVGGNNVSNIAHWDGANWWPMGVGFDSSVGVLAAGAGFVYAGGGFTNVTDSFTFTVNHIALWDGFNWYNLGSGVNANSTVNAIAVSGSTVYIGGTFTNASGVTANRIAMWDGANWNSLGSGSANGVNGTVLAIAVNGSDVYAGGTFANAGTTVVRGIAHWDGANWSGLGSGATGPSTAEVRALAFGGDGKLYCSGRFTNMSGLNVSSIARWDGTKWEALGSGLYANSPIVRGTSLTIRGNDIYVVGAFDSAGLADSSGVARWNDTIDFTPPVTMNFSRTQLLPGNTFKSRLTCTDRTTYSIDYSGDLQTWTPLMTNIAMQLDFTNAVSPSVNRRVFRARGIP